MHPLPIAVALAASLTLGAAAERRAAGTNAPARKPAPNLQPNPRKLNPPPGIVVPAAVRAELADGAAALGREIEALRPTLQGKPALLALLPDVQIFHHAVRYALEDDIFTSSNQFASARAILRQGHERAAALQAGDAPWNTRTGLLALKDRMETAAAAAALKKKAAAPAPLTHVPVVRGYVSRIDGSVQPYGLKVPVSFLNGDATPRRLDFWLHGRSDTLNEIAFLEGQQRAQSEFLAPGAFVLEPYGRFMNAFKFAGETDVWEALDDAARHFPIDRERLAMRGFSMGGAGAWHLGAHHPDRFAAVNPGAGFVDVKLYQKLADKPGGLDAIPWYERTLWNLYDPLACPINLINTTLVAYSGENDSQKAAADLMEAALLREGVRMTHIIGPKTGHAYEPNARKTVAGLVDQAVGEGVRRPSKVTLVTHTLKFNRAHWLTVDALEQHWEPARVEAELRREGDTLHVTARTRNVTALSFNLADGAAPAARCRVTLDGQELAAVAGGNPRAVKAGGRWAAGGVPGDTLLKRHNLQGPIDDAFMDSFAMVRPTGKALHPAAGEWARTELAEATFHWRRYFRGEPRVKDDAAVTEEDIRKHHLVLWGDPSSNRLLARIADRLPIRWNGGEIRVGTRSFDAARHMPAFLFPNPLNPARYVVINSGFTFPQYAGASNSQQTPKLPDWAVLDMGVPLAERVGGKGVVAADFFGERWEIRAR